MAVVDPVSVGISYRDFMVAKAVEQMPGRVGVGIDGFAGRLLPGTSALEDVRADTAPSC